MDGDVSVRIPARAEFLHLLRAVAAGVAARRGHPLDGIEDLKIAVSEAAAYLIDVRPPAGRIYLRLFSHPTSLEAVLCTNVPAARWPPPGAERSLAWKVLSVLADEAAFFLWDEVFPAFRLVRRDPQT